MRAIALAALLSSLPAVASADPPPAGPSAPAADATARRHLGFFLRLDGGVGFLGTSTYVDGVAASVSGVSIPFGVTAGAAVIENLVVAGEFWGTVAPTPLFTMGSDHQSPPDSGLSLFGVGPHVTYYFMPWNVYASLTPAVVFRTMKASGTTHDAKVGFGLKAAVGEEWWVGDHWGLGLALQFFLGVNQGTGAWEKLWTTLGGGLALSATYN